MTRLMLWFFVYFEAGELGPFSIRTTVCGGRVGSPQSGQYMDSKGSWRSRFGIVLTGVTGGQSKAVVLGCWGGG